jgi:hypothetical protein
MYSCGNAYDKYQGQRKRRQLTAPASITIGIEIDGPSSVAPENYKGEERYKAQQP